MGVTKIEKNLGINREYVPELLRVRQSKSSFLEFDMELMHTSMETKTQTPDVHLRFAGGDFYRLVYSNSQKYSDGVVCAVIGIDGRATAIKANTFKRNKPYKRVEGRDGTKIHIHNGPEMFFNWLENMEIVQQLDVGVNTFHELITQKGERLVTISSSIGHEFIPLDAYSFSGSFMIEMEEPKAQEITK